MLQTTRRLCGVALVTCGLSLPAWNMAAAQSTPDAAAHALAQRFSGTSNSGAAAERKRRDAAIKALQRKRDKDVKAKLDTAKQLSGYENEMLARARTEQAEEDRREQAAETERLDRERLAAEAEAARLDAERQAEADAAERHHREAEARQVRAEQIAEADRKGAEAKARADADRLETERLAQLEREWLEADRRAKREAQRQEDERQAKGEAERREQERLARQEAERRQAESTARQEAAESRRLSSRFESPRAGKSAAAPANDERSYLTGPHSEPSEAAGQAAAASRAPAAPRYGRVTILLLMEPGDRGVRRFKKTADPILCVADGCYVSNGPATPAAFAPGRKAFGFINTMGRRAGACRDSLACVFRDVDLMASSGFVQPVDMRWLRHDRREGRRVAPDLGCEARPGRLACGRAVESDNYKMWIVDDEVAEIAGVSGLEGALANHLETSRKAELKLGGAPVARH